MRDEDSGSEERTLSVTEEERVGGTGVLKGSYRKGAVTYRPNSNYLRLYEVPIAGGTDWW